MGPRACTINSCHNHKLYLAGRSVLQIVAATHITLAITINQLATVERPSVRFCTTMDLPLPQKSWFLISTFLFLFLNILFLLWSQEQRFIGRSWQSRCDFFLSCFSSQDLFRFPEFNFAMVVSLFISSLFPESFLFFSKYCYHITLIIN